MRVNKFRRSLLVLVLLLGLGPMAAEASHISGIRITQTGNTGLMINIDVTAFYTTGSTETTAYLGTYYNQVPAIAWGDGSTVPRYGSGTSTGIPLAATSTVVNGVPARSYRGSFSHTYGGPGNFTISANTACCPLTTPTYTLVTGTILTTTFTTSTPFSTMATVTTSFVQNTLGVDIVLPVFNKAFAPDTVAVGVPSTLTFTIDNSGSTLDDNALAFVDNLPAGVLVASPANPVNTCTGGTLTATSGTAVISYTGGTVAAGATCTISVDVITEVPGALVNTTGDFTSAFGNSGTATDTLTGTATPPTFSMAFDPDSIAIGDISTLIYTIDNTANAAAASGLSFTNNLPTGMEVAATARHLPRPNAASTTCTGGTLTAVPGTSVISYTGGTVLAMSTCTVSVDVTITTDGVFENDAGSLGSSLGSSPVGGTLAILGGSAAIPTLSEAGLMLLAAFLAFLAFVTLRRKKQAGLAS